MRASLLVPLIAMILAVVVTFFGLRGGRTAHAARAWRPEPAAHHEPEAEAAGS